MRWPRTTADTHVRRLGEPGGRGAPDGSIGDPVAMQGAQFIAHVLRCVVDWIETVQVVPCVDGAVSLEGGGGAIFVPVWSLHAYSS
jgi:hypothetical protein